MNKRLFFIISLIGILLLIIVTELPAKPIQISEITKKDIGKKVKVQGKIKEIREQNQIIKIKLENSNIEIIIFTKNFLSLKQDHEIVIEGKVDIYKNNIQIIADKISRVNNSS